MAHAIVGTGESKIDRLETREELQVKSKGSLLVESLPVQSFSIEDLDYLDEAHPHHETDHCFTQSLLGVAV